MRDIYDTLSLRREQEQARWLSTSAGPLPPSAVTFTPHMQNTPSHICTLPLNYNSHNICSAEEKGLINHKLMFLRKVFVVDLVIIVRLSKLTHVRVGNL